VSFEPAIRLMKGTLPESLYNFFYRSYFKARGAIRSRSVIRVSDGADVSKKAKIGAIFQLESFTSSSDILNILSSHVEKSLSGHHFFPIRNTSQCENWFALYVNATAFNGIIRSFVSQGFRVSVANIDRTSVRHDFYHLAKRTKSPLVLYKEYCSPGAAIVFSDDVSVHIHLLIKNGASGLVCTSRNGSFTELSIAELDNASAIAPFRQSNEYDFDVDVVFTWVNGEDPNWQLKRNFHASGFGAAPKTSLSDSRFKSRDELKYALRSVLTYAPWVRHIYLVTDAQVPTWLQEHDKVRLVDHCDIFLDKDILPVFNSHAIEANLHRIEGLSENFLYFNDDVMLRRSVSKSDFFSAFGRQSKFFYSAGSFIPLSKDHELLPVDIAAINNADLIKKMTGYRPRRKFQHTPIALKKSLVEKLEKAVPSVFLSNSISRFRDFDDYSILSALVHHYGYYLGEAQPSTISYDYINISDVSAHRRLERVAANDRKLSCFCVNDVESDDGKELSFFCDVMENIYPYRSTAEQESTQRSIQLTEHHHL
jgi:hypothetical protein